MNCKRCQTELQGRKFCGYCGTYNAPQRPTEVKLRPPPGSSVEDNRRGPKLRPPPQEVAQNEAPFVMHSSSSSSLQGSGDSTQIYKVVEPWGEVNVYPGRNRNRKRVSATLLTYEVEEGTQTGLALDGSLSMKKLYGKGAAASSFFGSMQTNEVEPVARDLCSFLAETVDYTGKTSVLYWACGNMGAEIEWVGSMDAAQALSYPFSGPKSFGKGTRLLEPLRYFEENSRHSPFSIFVFITDGALDDLEEVKKYTTWIAKSIEGGHRNPFKGVLIGLGSEVDEQQMIELDDLETGTEIDIWDHKLAGHLRQMWDIFAEVVERNKMVAPHGRILDEKGHVLLEYTQGLPCILEFDVPVSTRYIVLDVAGKRASPQPLFNR